MGKNDKKAGGKGGGKDKGGEKESGGKGKAAAQVINVRHILVRIKDSTRDIGHDADAPQCEKHSKKEEALAQLAEGVKFDEVARNFSEDKARQGEQHMT